MHVAVESSFVLILSLSQGIVDGRSSFSAVSSLRLPVPDSLQSARLCKPLLQVPRCNLIRMQTFSSSQHLLENLPGLFGLSPSFPLSASDRFSFRTLAPQGIFMLGFFCFVFFFPFFSNRSSRLFVLNFSQLGSTSVWFLVNKLFF